MHRKNRFCSVLIESVNELGFFNLNQIKYFRIIQRKYSRLQNDFRTLPWHLKCIKKCNVDSRAFLGSATLLLSYSGGTAQLSHTPLTPIQISYMHFTTQLGKLRVATV